jgi:hypothetical protein
MSEKKERDRVEVMVMALPQYCDYHVDRRTLGIQHAHRAGTPFIILQREQRTDLLSDVLPGSMSRNRVCTLASLLSLSFSLNTRLDICGF